MRLSYWPTLIVLLVSMAVMVPLACSKKEKEHQSASKWKQYAVGDMVKIRMTEQKGLVMDVRRTTYSVRIYTDADDWTTRNYNDFELEPWAAQPEPKKEGSQ